MERLEQRQMMAGDMSAYIDTDIYTGNDVLHVAEMAGQTDRANNVFIRQMSDNTIRVVGGVNGDGSISLVNGKQYVDFKFTPEVHYSSGYPYNYARPIKLDVQLGLGNDTVSITDITGSNTFFLRDLTINTTDRTPKTLYPPDAFTIATSPVNSVITAGHSPPTDQDSVYLSNISVREVSDVDTGGRISIWTGADNDTVSLTNVSSKDSDDYGAALGLGTGDGADRVEVYFSHFYGNVEISTGYAATDTGVDDLKLVDVGIEGGESNLTVELGGGNDTFFIDRVTLPTPRTTGFVSAFTLDAGAGNDTGTIKNVTTYDFKALMGDGSDTLALDYINAYNTDLQGQGGTDDKLTKNHMTVDKAFESGWETINGLPALKYGVTTTTLKLKSATLVR
jgi:hypothetical protein